MTEPKKKQKTFDQATQDSLEMFMQNLRFFLTCCLGHVSDCPPSAHAQMNGANDGGPIKSNSEGRAIQLSRSMMEQLAVSEKPKKEGGAWC